jgi:hypothetical protein
LLWFYGRISSAGPARVAQFSLKFMRRQVILFFVVLSGGTMSVCARALQTRIVRQWRQVANLMIPKTPFDPKAFLTKIAEGRTVAEYSKNEMVFAQGDPANAVFYIQKGKIKLTIVSNAGKEAIVAILGVGDFVGEGCLKAQPLRLASPASSIRHLPETSCCIIPSCPTG